MTKSCCNRTYEDFATFCVECGELLAEAPVVNEALATPAINTESAPSKPDLLQEADSTVLSECPRESPKTVRPEPVIQKARGSIRDHWLRLKDSLLPDQDRERGWEINGARTRRSGFDHWSLRNNLDGRKGRFNRYHSGAVTSPADYDKLKQISDPSLARLDSYGTAGKDQLRYEITEEPPGQPLSQWLMYNRGEAAAAVIMRAGCAILAALTAQNLRPIALTPSMLYIDGNRLILSVFGAIISTDDAGYHEYLAASPLIPAPWAEPEISTRTMTTPTGGVFSVAQLAAAVCFGDPPSHDTLLNGRFAFQQINESGLREFLMTALWPYNEGRLNFGQKPKIPAWESLRPGAAADAYSLGGKSYWHAGDLLRATSENWIEATENLSAIKAWFEKTPHAALARSLSGHPDKSADWQLVRLCRLTAPDAPLFWDSYDLSDDVAERNLVALAQAAIEPADNTPAAVSAWEKAQHDLAAMFKADLRGAFTLADESKGEVA